MIYALSIYLPFFAAFVMLARGLSTHARQAVCFVAAAPALWAAAMVGEGGTEVGWLFLNAHFGLDDIRQVFLLFTALLWTVAGLFAGAYLEKSPRQRIFYFLYLLTMSGNFGLILAEDLPSFYTFFALMTFSAYGLVVFDGSKQAHRAGRVYIVMAILGEAMLLAAIFFSVHEAGSIMLRDLGPAISTADNRDLIMALSFGGFGVKAGAVGLHMWLPLAHPVAPTPASAVLSGCMIKAGLLGWMHFLPIGYYASDGWSTVIIVAGLTAAFGAVAVGVWQEDAKTILAYSSISQMGVMTVAVGIGLGTPEGWPAVAVVLAVYAFSHGLAKGALFLGVGIASAVGTVAARYIAIGGLFLAAAAIAGAPLTSGAITKKALSGLVPFAPGTWPNILEWMLVLSAVATTLLLGRFLVIILRAVRADPKSGSHPSMMWSWIFGLALVAVGVWGAIPYYALEVDLPGLALADVWDATGPVVAGAALLWIWTRMMRGREPAERVPAGDLLIPVERLGAVIERSWGRLPSTGPQSWAINFEPMIAKIVESERKRSIISGIERSLAHWNVAGLWFLLLLVVIVVLVFVERLT